MTALAPFQTSARFIPSPNWGPIGMQVFERTYSRPLYRSDGTLEPWVRDEWALLGDGPNESWEQTVARVVDGNLDLAPPTSHRQGERDLLDHLIGGMSIIPGGRHLWSAGTSVVQSRNCHRASFSERNASHFERMLLLLMHGGGVGTNYSSEYLARCRPLLGRLHIILACRADHPDFARLAHLVDNERAANASINDSGSTFTLHRVCDSREGWADAIGAVFDTAEQPGAHTVVIDLSEVRPFGSRLVTAGGTASGPGPLAEMLTTLAGIVSEAEGRRLTGMEAMRIDHAVAAAVIAGGKRRSARIAMMHWLDPEVFDFIHCKADLGAMWTANISVEVDGQFHKACLDAGHPQHGHARKVLDQVVDGMLRNGEPGFANTELAAVGERGDVRCYNPCIAGDSMIETTEGRLPVTSLLGREVTVVVDGREWKTTPEGFFQTGVKPTVQVTVSCGDGLQYRVLRCTPDHLVSTPNGWTKAGELSPGSLVDLDMRPAGVVVSIDQRSETDVYDCQVPGLNAFVANGIIVHNCGEIALEEGDPALGEDPSAGEACNLVQVNLAKFAHNPQGAILAFELAGRYAYRATLAPLNDDEEQKIESRNRRLGVGFMGFAEWLIKRGVHYADAADDATTRRLLTEFREAARRGADELADELGLPRSIKVTAVAPTGTTSKLAGTTSGMQPLYARYYLNRVRYSPSEFAALTAPDMATVAEVSDDPNSPGTKVVARAVMEPVVAEAFDESLCASQNELTINCLLAVQAMVQETFCGGSDGNAISFTANIDSSVTAEELTAALLEHLPSMKGTTVFPDISDEEAAAIQAPLQRITRDQFLAYGGQIGQAEEVCVGGACPVR